MAGSNREPEHGSDNQRIVANAARISPRQRLQASILSPCHLVIFARSRSRARAVSWRSAPGSGRAGAPARPRSRRSAGGPARSVAGGWRAAIARVRLKASHQADDPADESPASASSTSSCRWVTNSTRAPSSRRPARISRLSTRAAAPDRYWLAARSATPGWLGRPGERSAPVDQAPRPAARR